MEAPNALAVGETGVGLVCRGLPADILAMRDEGHLFGDDPGAGEFELRDVRPRGLTRLDPGRAQARQAALHVDLRARIGVGPRGVVHPIKSPV